MNKQETEKQYLRRVKKLYLDHQSKPPSESELRQRRVNLDLTPDQKKVFKYCVEETYVICEEEAKDPVTIAKSCKLRVDTVNVALKRLIELDIIDSDLSYII
jgi:hypothetical protein